MWTYTPRQIEAFLFIAGKREQQDDARTLGLNAMAARGDPDKLKALQEKLGRE